MKAFGEQLDAAMARNGDNLGFRFLPEEAGMDGYVPYQVFRRDATDPNKGYFGGVEVPSSRPGS